MEQVKCYKFGQHTMLSFSVFISDISSPEDLFEGTKDRLFFVSIFLTLKLDKNKKTDTLDLVLGLSIVKTTSLYPYSRSLFRKSLEWKKTQLYWVIEASVAARVLHFLEKKIWNFHDTIHD